MPDQASNGYQLVSLGQFGARARPLREGLREASLVIGLGQIGLHTIAQIHHMLGSMLTWREIQNRVRLLAIARRRSILEEALVPREARLSLDQDPIDWSDVPGRYAQWGVAQWWPHSPSNREQLEDPNQVRAYSRLTLYTNAALISEALFKLTQWLMMMGTVRDQGLRRRIYVVGSLAEAEGSAMIFDITARLRALVRSRPTTIMGVFSLCARPNPHDPDNIAAMANVYATLREIDSYTLHPETFMSMLPAIGHSLDRANPQRALDMIFLTGDTTAPDCMPPETALAELVTTWIAASLAGPHPPQLPEPIEHEPGTDRLNGYSTFSVSKLALPTRAAMDLAAVGLAQATLRAIKSAHATTPTTTWVEQMMMGARSTVIESNVLQAPDVNDRLREWSYDLSVAGLTRKLEGRANRGESSQMLDLIQGEWRRLERERIGDNAAEQGLVNTVSDTLRCRIDTALALFTRDLQNALLTSPVELAYNKGLGLVWALSALDELERRLRRVLPDFQSMLNEALAAHQIGGQALLEAAKQYDARGGGRFGGSRRALSTELDTRAAEALRATANLVAVQARLDVWQHLLALVDDVREQIRDVIPQVEHAIDALHQFEVACREAMEQAAFQPPHYPSGVALTEEWYVHGIQGLTGGVGQLPPRELLRQVYGAWTPPADLHAERQLSRFLTDIREAARRALAGSFQFADLYEFLEQNQGNGTYQQALEQLPQAATPVLIPADDDLHPASRAYELVREVERPYRALNAVQPGVIRSFVHSPDPDEITVIRVLHGMMAEAVPSLRETYRRAYDRAAAEGMALHIDRRWDADMADLVHTSARREISIIWEDILNALTNGPRAVQTPLDQLIHMLGVALDVMEASLVPDVPADLRLVLYRLRPFHLKLPPPTCAVLYLYSNRPAEDLSEEIHRAITPVPLEEQFAFVVNLNGRPDIEHIVERLRRENYTVLVLNESHIKRLISARLPTRALGDLVLSQVNLTTISPFYTRGPVPEHMFFGREREINEVRSKLRTHSVALIGGRRIGKTSTLQRIQRLLKPADSDYVPYYLDCHGATNYRTFFWLINRRWQIDVPQDANPVEFEDVVTILQQRHIGKNIAILFDEIDSLLEFDRQPDNHETLFRAFRSLSNEKHCQYVFSGEKWLMRSMTNPYSALFNFAEAVRLEPLPRQVVHHLVADPFEMLNIWIEQSEQVIERIHEISAGHPNIVQMICQGMVQELDQDPQNTNLLKYKHLDDATSRRTLQEEIVQTIWGQMSPLARLITLTWPEGQRLLSLSEIEELLQAIGVIEIPPERLERTAKDLELYCFVHSREQDRLELIPMAFPAILDFMTDKQRQIEIVRRHYEVDPDGTMMVS
jgi:hypothetical protein